MRTSAYTATVGIGCVKMSYKEASRDATSVICISAIAEYTAKVLVVATVVG